ncbi:alpha/beta hydrolase [Candidatus Fermentibacterales bacterium]|nr:alpha/beta hydrolase [Candidatus Fermentibacterales bacterium]
MKMNKLLGPVAAAVSAAVLSLSACGGETPTELDLIGTWEGRIDVAGISLQVKVDFLGAGETLQATIDIPEQSAFGLPLVGVALRGDSVRFDLPSNLGTARFAGVLSGDNISGSFTQGGAEGSFALSRVAVADVAPLPYASRDVIIEGAGFQLAGTLTLPEGAGPFPGVILLTGSGAQNRDEAVFGFRVFGVLADHLTRSGVAVLRCDDRGVGGSTGGGVPVTDSLFAADASLMLDYMLADSSIASGKVGVLGHSEGSNTAFMLAAERPEDVAFVVSMAGPSISGYDVLLSQIAKLSELAGLSEEQTAERLESQRAIMDMVLGGQDLSGLDSLFRTQMMQELQDLPPEQIEALGEDLDDYIDSAVEQSIAEISSPWFLRFLSRDPALDISRVACPVLALYGSLDCQVTIDANAGPMELALTGNPDHAVIVVEGANHLFQEAVAGSVEEYAALESHFIRGFPETICQWIAERFQ